MTRNFAWRFLEIGRRIERARQLAELTRGLVCGSAGARERRQPAPAAGARRQLHDLSLALPDDAADRAGARPAAARRDQPARRRLPARASSTPISTPRCRSEGPHRSPGQRLILKLLTAVRLAEVERAAASRARTRRWPARRRCSAALARRPAAALRRDRPQLLRPCRDAGRHPRHAAGGTSRDLRGQPPHRLPLQPAGLDLAPPPAPDAARRRHQPAATRRSRSPRRPRSARRDIDYFGNPTTFVTIQQNHIELVLHALSTSRSSDRPVAATRPTTPPWESGARSSPATARPRPREALEFTFASPYVPLAPSCAPTPRASFAPGRPILEAARELTAPHPPRLHATSPAPPSVATAGRPRCSPMRRGVCQDFAHIQIACLRALGLPARYVSGYLLTRPRRGQGAAGRRRRLARLAVGLGAGPRLGRPRSDQRRDPRPRAHHRRLGPRLWRRQPGQRRDVRRRRAPHRRRGPRRAGRRRRRGGNDRLNDAPPADRAWRAVPACAMTIWCTAHHITAP